MYQYTRFSCILSGGPRLPPGQARTQCPVPPPAGHRWSELMRASRRSFMGVAQGGAAPDPHRPSAPRCAVTQGRENSGGRTVGLRARMMGRQGRARAMLVARSITRAVQWRASRRASASAALISVGAGFASPARVIASSKADRSFGVFNTTVPTKFQNPTTCQKATPSRNPAASQPARPITRRPALRPCRGRAVTCGVRWSSAGAAPTPGARGARGRSSALRVLMAPLSASPLRRFENHIAKCDGER